jgi:ABC-type oligopeptide transport system substrate-binding subunit
MPSPFKPLLLAGVALCAVSSCRNQERDGSVPQIYYKAIYSKVLTFDPSRMTDTASLSVANQIYDGLLEFGPHFDLQPALAETCD